MPMTPTTALLWRQWRETRIAMFAAVAFAFALAGGLSAAQGSREGYGARDLNSYSSVLMSVVAATTGFALLFSHSNRAHLSSGLTAQWFTVPIHNTRFALTLILYRLAAMAAVVGTSLTVFNLALRTPELVEELRSWQGSAPSFDITVESILSAKGAVSYGLVALALFAWIQAFEWSLRRFSGLVTWCAHGGLVWSLIWMLNTYGAQSPALTALAGWTLAPAVLLAGVGLILQRRGVALHIAIPSFSAPSMTRSLPFHTADEALRWFSWRSGARDVARVALVATVAALGWTLISVARGTLERDTNVKLHEAPIYFLVILGVFSVLIALPGGLYTASRSRTLMRGCASGAFAALPVTTQRLSAAGFCATARLFLELTALYTAGAVFVAVATDLALDGYRTSIWGQLLGWEPVGGLLLVTLTAFALYQGGRFLIAIYAIVILAVTLMMVLWPDWITETNAFLAGYAIAYVVTVTAIAACTFYIWRRGHADTRGVAWVCGAAVLMAPAIIWLQYLAHGWPEALTAETILLLAACHAACALPLVAWPAYLARLRTR